MRVLQRRPTNLIDVWAQERYRRVIRIDGNPRLIAVENRGSIDAPDVRLMVRAEDGGSPATARERREAARITSAILGLDVDASAPQRRAEVDPALRDTALALRGMRPPHYPDLFETFASVIPFQQLSLQAGMAAVAKLVHRFGHVVTFSGMRCFAFPLADSIAEAPASVLERCGMSRHKAHSLHSAARAIASGTLRAEALVQLPSSEALARLVELPGIGPWSAALILLRGFGRVDVFPQADSGAESSLIALMHLRSRASLARVIERFGEYRGFLYFYGLASRLLAAGLIHPARSASGAMSRSRPVPSGTLRLRAAAERAKPTRAQLLAAAGKTVPDVIARGLGVLFCGINPGLYSGATRHHFARPGNRFWRALQGGGFTDRVLDPWDERDLLKHGCGITNLVARATASAKALADSELVDGRRRLETKVKRYAPTCVAVLGIGAYRTAFDRPAAVLGRQPESLGGAVLWVLPNPSGLNAHHQLGDLIDRFRALWKAVKSS